MAWALMQPQELNALGLRLRVRNADEEKHAWSGLMASAQRGDAVAYRRLLSEVRTWLRRYYAGRLPPAMIDDVIQETLIAIHEKRQTYDPARPFSAWLSVIARYKWIDALRTMKARHTETLHADVAVPDHEEAVTSAWSLERLLEQIKPAQSEVIRLVKLQGLSIAEASAATGQSAPLVKVNIHRGLKRLASLLRGELDAD
ncbi:DNA-directed RNA polymerase sigma-70 factor [Aliidongia dinghuensis]|uniref:DNA-directed RNA polymerase sigma-70 factor n=1 Tax=Aliidongia dinghuensis TaxID=1867774 RepID=A0A8J2YYW1_9PROT|nr:sigma-70 family RNA polymerase sigma factor [Aliidongia dinghuensis]GGF42635.1 DNA-directed RNA polymerase sigma-70 factor [Aliidongia dinghuensis]